MMKLKFPQKMKGKMKGKIIKVVVYSLGILIAIYITGMRLFSFVFELGFKTPATDNIKNFLIFNLPDFISVLFCFSFIILFVKKLKEAIKRN